MELKGYRYTSIGLLPEDWCLNILSEIGSIHGRVGWKGYTVKDLCSSGAYTIGAKHIDKQNRLDLNDPTFLSQEKFLESPDIMVVKGDILIVQRGSIGKVVLIDREIGDATINPSMLILRLKSVLPLYVYYYFVSRSGQNQILSDTSSTGVPMITQRQVLAFKIPIPNKVEQIAIAMALSDLDALIAQTEMLIEKKRAIKQGLMQKLLSPFDEKGKLKLEWRIKLLGDVFMFGSTANYSRAELSTNDVIGYIHYGDIHTKYNSFLDGQCSQLPGISQSRAKGFSMIQEGDVVIADASEDYNGVGKSIEVINLGDKKVIAGLHTILLRDSTSMFHTGFRGLLFDSKFIKNQFWQLATGLKVYSLSKSILKQIKLFVPPKHVQESISNLIHDLISEIEDNNQKLGKLKLIKQAMMQSLLTGKIRIYKPEHEPATPV